MHRGRARWKGGGGGQRVQLHPPRLDIAGREWPKICISCPGPGCYLKVLAHLWLKIWANLPKFCMLRAHCGPI